MMLGFRVPAWFAGLFPIVVLCAIYGFLSTPTPESIGLPELAIALLLIVLSIRPALLALISPLSKSEIPASVRVAFLYLLLVPTITGLLINQNELHDFIRDIIPLFFMFLPLFLYRILFRYPDRAAKWIAVGLYIAGLGFMLQFSLDPSVDLTKVGLMQMVGENRDNPYQDPSAVFFSALSAALMVWSLFRRKWVLGLLAFFGLAFAMAVYTVTVTRAPIGLSLLVLFMVYLIESWKGRHRFVAMFLGGIFLAGMVYAIWQAGWVEMGWRMIAAKNEASGVLNARDQEALAVLSNIDSVPRLLFGEGWGGLIANPVAGGAKLRYVHNLILFSLFKSGILGLAALMIYLFWCFRSLLHIRKLFHMNHFVFLALLATMAPLVVAGWLEPMYKALSFGLVLCLWVAIDCMVQCRRLMGTERYAR